MFNSPILDLIILLSFTYFIGSLILISANEFIAAVFRLRQRNLKYALQNLFPNSPNTWQSFVQGTLINSPHIQSLMLPNSTYPCYIPAKNFVSALIQQIGGNNFNPTTIATTISTNTALPTEIKQVMLDLLAKTQNDLDKFQIELETFYNDAMDRAGGWYKRRIRTIMLIVAGAIAIALNIDTLKIINDSLKNPDKLSKTVDNISTEMKNISLQHDTVFLKDPSQKILLQVYSGIDTGMALKDSVTLKKSKENFEKLKMVYEQNTGYTLGYSGKGNFSKEWFISGWWLGWIFWKKILGILITVFALQLGANYWFDMLNRTINIRSAGKKPGEKKKE